MDNLKRLQVNLLKSELLKLQTGQLPQIKSFDLAMIIEFGPDDTETETYCLKTYSRWL